MTTFITIEQALQNCENFKGWFYLQEKPWTLETRGFFRSADLNLSLEEEAAAVEALKKDGWTPTVTTSDIEDIIDNLEYQAEGVVSAKKKLEALEYFYENDAYIDLE